MFTRAWELASVHCVTSREGFSLSLGRGFFAPTSDSGWEDGYA